MSLKKVVISGGGTGGHIFPALSIANEIKRRYPECRVIFTGARGRMEADKVPEAGYEILLLRVEGLSRKRNPFRHLRTLYLLLRAFFSVRRELRLFKPQIVIGVGGYASAPTLLAAQNIGAPTLVQEQNSYAGVTNRLVGKRAKTICVAYKGMERFFPKKKKILLTGNPVRSDLLETPKHLPEAYEHFGLDPSKKTILVVGGSLGARTLNKSTAAALKEIAEKEDSLQLLWQCGKSYAKEAHRILKEEALEDRNIFVHQFINRMDFAYSVADLVVSRAGAGSISEFSLLGLPVILVPSPNVAEDHQTKNAEALEKEGAAILIPDSKAESELFQQVFELIEAPEKRALLTENIRALALPDAAARIVDEIESLTSHS